MMLYKIERIAVASTANITEEDARHLTIEATNNVLNKLPVIYEKAEYGWWVVITGDDKQLQEQDAALKQACFSAALRALIIEAWKQGVQWLMIDRDAEPVQDAPVFEW